MTYPQTMALELTGNINHVAKNIQAIAKYGCLAMCYLYCIGLDGDAISYIEYVSCAMEKGYLDKDCTVLDGAKYLSFFCNEKHYKVTKQDILNSDIKNIKEKTPVRFDYNGNSHWVVVEKGRIVFNPLLNSVCVNKGKPVTARIISLR